MKHRYLNNVTTLSYDELKCNGCGRCAEVCPHRVFDLAAKKARIVERDACMECGACTKNCPAEAIEVEAGAGCATAIMMGCLTGEEPACGCGESGCC